MANSNFKIRVPLQGSYYIVLLSFIFILSITFISPIFSLFLKSILGSDSAVGYFNAFNAVVLLLSNLLVGKFLQYRSKIKLLKISILIFGITFLFYPFINNFYSLLIIEIIRYVSEISVFICLGLLLRDLTTSKNLGKVEGWSFAVANMAWLIGPLLGGFIAAKYNHKIVFLISAIIVFCAYLLASRNHLHFKEPKKKESFSILKNLKYYFKNRNLKVLYLASMGIVFWWSLIYTFLPLFMAENNLNASDIGLVLGLIVVPLILLEIPAGKLADKFGYKKLLFLGFIIISLCGLIAYFSTNIRYTIAFIILASIGAAFLEQLREAFFFKSIKKQNENDLYPIFKTGIDMGRIVGLLIFSTVLLFFRFENIFLIVAIVMFIFGLLMLLLKEK